MKELKSLNNNEQTLFYFQKYKNYFLSRIIANGKTYDKEDFVFTIYYAVIKAMQTYESNEKNKKYGLEKYIFLIIWTKIHEELRKYNNNYSFKFLNECKNEKLLEITSSCEEITRQQDDDPEYEKKLYFIKKHLPNQNIRIRRVIEYTLQGYDKEEISKIMKISVQEVHRLWLRFVWYAKNKLRN